MKSCAVKIKCQTENTHYYIDVYNEGKQGLMLIIQDDADREVYISAEHWTDLVNVINNMLSQKDLEEVLANENF